MASRAGNAKENIVRDLVALGHAPTRPGVQHFAMCGRASRGPADVLAIACGYPPLLIQVKGDKGSPYANFRREAREELRAVAATVGGEAWLAWLPLGRTSSPRWYHESLWPS